MQEIFAWVWAWTLASAETVHGNAQAEHVIIRGHVLPFRTLRPAANKGVSEVCEHNFR